MIKRIGVGALVVVVLIGSSFVGYGWWTRRGAPSFSQGGAFGAARSSVAPTAILMSADGRPARAGRSVTAGNAGALSVGGAPSAGSSASSARASAGAARVKTVTVAFPAEGSYTYQGTGTERIEFGSTSPCEWAVDDVTMQLQHDGTDTISDWTYSDSRQERHISGHTGAGVYTKFVGAAVTCLGVRRTEESTYKPMARRVAYPLEPGARWSMTADAGGRTEQVSGEIIGRARIKVPAGTFDTFKIHLRADISGEQTGAYETTFWFAPVLGIAVKQIAHTEVVSSGAHFTSQMTLLLASAP